jgi:hypothetical protein
MTADNHFRAADALLAEQRNLPADGAAALVAKVSNCRITQVVDIKKKLPSGPGFKRDHWNARGQRPG